MPALTLSRRSRRGAFLALRATLVLCLATISLRAAETSYAADLEAFVNDVEKNYPFFDEKKIRDDWNAKKRVWAKELRSLKSDVQFVELLVKVLECMRDGHASFDELTVTMPKRPPEFFPGVVFLPAPEGRVVVMGTAPHLERALPRGTVVLAINGKPARQYLDARGQARWKEGGFFSSPQRATFFEYRLPLRGERGDKHKLQILVGRSRKTLTLTSTVEVGGWDHNYNMPSNLERSGRSVSWARLEGDVGYIYLRRMDESVEPGIKAALEGVPGARGWVVDLRGNTGGGYDTSLKELIRTLKGPVAGIIDAGCVSAGETFARDLVNQCGATLFGSRSAGSSSSKTVFALPSGLAKIRYSVRSRGGVGGNPIEFHGVDPHVSIDADPQLVAEGINAEIEAARKHVLEKSGGKDAGGS